MLWLFIRTALVKKATQMYAYTSMFSHHFFAKGISFLYASLDEKVLLKLGLVLKEKV